MIIRNRCVFGWFADVLVAIVASPVAYPLVGELWLGSRFDVEGLFRMSGNEWLMLTAVIFLPGATLGVLAGRIARWRSPERAPGTVIAGAVAFGASAATSAAFIWWLTIVL